MPTVSEMDVPADAAHSPFLRTAVIDVSLLGDHHPGSF